MHYCEHAEDLQQILLNESVFRGSLTLILSYPQETKTQKGRGIARSSHQKAKTGKFGLEARCLFCPWMLNNCKISHRGRLISILAADFKPTVGTFMKYLICPAEGLGFTRALHMCVPGCLVQDIRLAMLAFSSHSSVPPKPGSDSTLCALVQDSPKD